MTRSRILLALLLPAALLQTTALGQKKFLRSFRVQGVQADSSAYPPSNNVSHMNAENGALWIGTSKGVARTLDGGRSWTSYRSDTAFANDGIFAIATRQETVWAATGYDKETADGSVQTGSGYAVSTSGGYSWSHLGQAMDSRGDSIFAYGIND